MTEVVLDIETDSLDATVIHCIVCKNIHTKQLSIFKGEECYDKFKKFSTGVTKFIMHNGISFDAPVLNRLSGTSIKLSQIEDTLILSRMFYKDRDSNSLASWGETFNYSKGDFNEFDKLTDDMIMYCIRDVEITEKLWHKINRDWLKYEQRRFSSAINLEYHIQQLIKQQVQNGWKVDVKKLYEVRAELKDKSAEIEQSLQERYKPIVEQRISEKTGKRLKDKVTIFNPASRKQIGERLMADGWVPKMFTPTKQPMVDETILENVDLPAAQEIATYLTLGKRISMLDSWLEFVQDDGKIHGEVFPLGTITHRMTHKDPNVAQVVSSRSLYGKEMRECWTTSSDDLSLLGCDASGLELRCLAHYMGDEEYVKLILEGDVHSYNQQIAGLPTRDAAKTFIYALIYGAGDAKIGSIIGGTAKDGHQMISKFMEGLPALSNLKKKVTKIAESSKHVAGLDGRPLTIRSPHSILNLLLQSAGAILCKQWLVQIMQKHSKEADYPVKLLASIHDEYQFELPDAHADHFGKLTQSAMKTVEEIYNFKCPLDSEYKIGKNWAETH